MTIILNERGVYCPQCACNITVGKCAHGVTSTPASAPVGWTLRQALENLAEAAEFAVQSADTAQAGDSIATLAVDCEIARDVLGGSAAGDAATVAGRWACVSGRTIQRDGFPFVFIGRECATAIEADRFARALPALLELAALTRAGLSMPATLARLAAMALDTVEGKAGL